MLALWKPFNELTRFSREFEELFYGRTRNDHGVGFTPTVDIKENENSIVLHADIPGVSEKDIEVKVEDGKLILSGKRETSKEEKTKIGSYNERSYGSFLRQFTLGPNIETNKIEAGYKNGVLTLTLPKKEEVKPKHISIKS